MFLFKINFPEPVFFGLLNFEKNVECFEKKKLSQDLAT